MRILAIAYAGLGYLAFLASFTYLIFFTADLLVPKGLSDGPETPARIAAAINVGLIALFAVQHTIMARPGFKEKLTRIIPHSMERATFVWASDLILALILWQWRPMNGVLWDLSGTAAGSVLFALFWSGWGLVVASSFFIDHFGLFGLRQALGHGKSAEGAAPTFRAPLLYAFVRHPMMLGIFLGLWAAPLMTTGRLVLAGAFSVYMLVGMRFEERGLVAEFGKSYEDYQGQVPMVLPVPGKRYRG